MASPTVCPITPTQVVIHPLACAGAAQRGIRLLEEEADIVNGYWISISKVASPSD